VLIGGTLIRNGAGLGRGVTVRTGIAMSPGASRSELVGAAPTKSLADAGAAGATDYRAAP